MVERYRSYVIEYASVVSIETFPTYTGSVRHRTLIIEVLGSCYMMF